LPYYRQSKTSIKEYAFCIDIHIAYIIIMENGPLFKFFQYYLPKLGRKAEDCVDPSM